LVKGFFLYVHVCKHERSNLVCQLSPSSYTTVLSRASRGDPPTLRVFKLHRPSRPATLTPNTFDTPEDYDRQDLLTNTQNTSVLKPQRTRLPQHKNRFRHWSIPDIYKLESPVTGQLPIYAI